MNQVGLEKSDYKKKNRFYTAFKSMYRPSESDLNYLLYSGWESNKFNNTATFGWNHSYDYKKGNGNLNLEVVSSTIGSDFNYAKVALTSINKRRIGKLQLNTRFFAQYGSGDNWASESKLYLASANPEDLMNHKLTRAQGFVPNDWTGYGVSTNQFHMGGGLNLRGYAGYLAPELDAEGNYTETYAGTSGASISTELEFHKILPVIKRQRKLKAYFFADAGLINTTQVTYQNWKDSFTSVRSDAGIGFALTLDRWGALETVRPFTLRIDFPMLLNKYPNVDESHIQANRFVLGIGRAFK
tara:strand:- start:5084 stop:5980 length:897 start_codon:yes stop_codon:yes gene_type:complete